MRYSETSGLTKSIEGDSSVELEEDAYSMHVPSVQPWLGLGGFGFGFGFKLGFGFGFVRVSIYAYQRG